MPCFSFPRRYTELLFTFIDPQTWTFYFLYNSAEDKVSTFSRIYKKSSLSVYKEVIMNFLKDKELLDVNFNPRNLKVAVSYKPVTSLYNRQVILVYLDRAHLHRIKQYTKKPLIIEDIPYYYVPQAVGTPFMYRADKDILSWLLPSETYIDTKEEILKVYPKNGN